MSFRARLLLASLPLALVPLILFGLGARRDVSRRLQGLAGVKAVRSSSEFGFSMITVIFEDRTNLYFARQRVSERLAESSNFLPKGVTPYLGPDASALGQVFWYTLEPSKDHPIDPSRL